MKYSWSITSVYVFQGRIQGGAKIGPGSLLQKSSSSDRKAIATNRMHSNDQDARREEVLLFCVPFQNQNFHAF